jgi:hypothetical protein
MTGPHAEAMAAAIVARGERKVGEEGRQAEYLWPLAAQQGYP